jgi:hypothetical protein
MRYSGKARPKNLRITNSSLARKENEFLRVKFDVAITNPTGSLGKLSLLAPKDVGGPWFPTTGAFP